MNNSGSTPFWIRAFGALLRWERHSTVEAPRLGAIPLPYLVNVAIWNRRGNIGSGIVRSDLTELGETPCTMLKEPLFYRLSLVPLEEGTDTLDSALTNWSAVCDETRIYSLW